MLKIVEVHPSANPQGEYVVLQNLGLVTVSLRGWAACTDDYLEGCPQAAASGMYIFREDITVRPYTRVVLFTGCGEDGWVPTIDGKQAYCAFWKRNESVWKRSQNVHVLQIATSRKVIPTAGKTAVASQPSAPQSNQREEEKTPQREAACSV